MKELKMSELNRSIADVGIEEEIEAITTGNKEIDKLLVGHRFSEVTIWSGTPGSGKSTMVSNLSCNFINNGDKVFVMSGEFKNERIKTWLYSQLSGKKHITATQNKFNHKMFKTKIDIEVSKKIDKWTKEKLYIHSDKNLTDAAIFKSMELSYAEEGTRIFVLDNIMSIDLQRTSDSKWDDQKEFLKKLKYFANTHNVHIHLVAHPKKLPEGKSVDMYDIAGSSDIPNLVDNILFLKRLNEVEIEKVKEKTGFDYTTVCKILKNREYGNVGEEVAFSFEPVSKRFYDPLGAEELKLEYGWVEESDIWG
jgi:twinkle protein